MVLTEPSRHRVPDAAIVAESLRRPERFADLFEAYHAEIYRYVASRLSVAHADDLAAETFLIAFRSRAAFAGSPGHVRAWLYGIATNLVRRHRRDEERKYRALERVEALDPTRGTTDDGADGIVSRVAALGIQRELGGALRRLAAGDRDVLLLVAVAGLNYAEVAAALDIPQGTVGSRLNRARKLVRAALGEVGPTVNGWETY
jgi:RNA polymerase sigma factor (sigma-70 family)